MFYMTLNIIRQNHQYKINYYLVYLKKHYLKIFIYPLFIVPYLLKNNFL